MSEMKFYENRLRSMLEVAGLSVKASYLPAEVQQILNIKDHTFRLMCEKWEPPGTAGRPKVGLESYTVHTHRRVPFHGLVDWLAENCA